MYFGNRSEIDSYTDTTPDDGEINAIVMDLGFTFFAVEFEAPVAPALSFYAAAELSKFIRGCQSMLGMCNRNPMW